MNKLIKILKEKKSIPLDKFINIALYDKKFGYYMKKNPFGKEGDFITSPLISILFAEMIAVWCVAYWENLGKPKKIFLVELGPGNGLLCKDLLKTFKKFEEFYNCLEIKLLEVSDNLKVLQKKILVSKKVKWIKSIEKINRGPLIFLGNEFFDALPIKQIYKRNNLWFEKHVCLYQNNKKFEFSLKKFSKKLKKNINKLDLISLKNCNEYPVVAIKYLILITKKIKKLNGCLITFDYGFSHGKKKNSLQSIRKHKYINFLENISNSDITSHVNFELFSEFLKKNRLDVKKVIPQNEFLQKMGIIERAGILSKKMTFKQKANMFYRLKKLLDHKEMGAHFKVLFAHKKGQSFSLGF